MQLHGISDVTDAEPANSIWLQPMSSSDAPYF